MDSDVESESGAEQAFEHLRAEVATLRRAFETLPDVFKANRPKDYSPTLGVIAQKLEAMGDALQAIESHPAIRTTPAQHNQFLAGAGETLVGRAVKELDNAAAAAAKERRELAAMIGSMRGQDRQLKWLAWSGVGAFVLGLLISPVFARLLPFGWDGHIAAFIMNADRWNAGSALMEAGNPEAWRIFRKDFDLIKDNQEAIAACRNAVARAKKEQHCTIVVIATAP